MARFFLLCLSAACLALLLPPVQSRRAPGTGAGAGRDDRLLFPEPHFDAAEPAEQQGDVAMRKAATLSSRSPPAPTAGGVVTPELRTVPGGANPFHGSITQERTSPGAAAGSVATPELRTTPLGSNPLHNR